MNINLDSQARRQALRDIQESLSAEKKEYMAMYVTAGHIVVKILNKELGLTSYMLNDTACNVYRSEGVS